MYEPATARAPDASRRKQLSEVTLLEPSAVMRSLCPIGSTLWALRAEELNASEGRFDVITCLWNVLGHIFPAASRIEALRQSRGCSRPKAASSST